MMANWLTGGVIIDAFVAADDWDLAVAEGEEALAAVTDPGDEHRLLAFATLIRVSRGDPTDAAVARLEELVGAGATSDPGDEQMVRLIRALRRTNDGDLEGAFDEATRRGRALSRRVRAALPADRREGGALGRRRRSDARCRRAREAAARHRRRDPPAPRRDGGRDRGPRGTPAEAIGGYRAVVAEALRQGDGYEGATEALDAVVLLGTDDAELRALAAQAREVLGRVGARPFLERLDAAIAGPPVAAGEGSPAAGGGGSPALDGVTAGT